MSLSLYPDDDEPRLLLSFLLLISILTLRIILFPGFFAIASPIRLDAVVSWSIVLESRAMSQFAKRVVALGHFTRIYAVSCKDHWVTKLRLRLPKKWNVSTFTERINEREDTGNYSLRLNFTDVIR